VDGLGFALGVSDVSYVCSEANDYIDEAASGHSGVLPVIEGPDYNKTVHLNVSIFQYLSQSISPYSMYDY
jgi:hypothetical protein